MAVSPRGWHCLKNSRLASILNWGGSDGLELNGRLGCKTKCSAGTTFPDLLLQLEGTRRVTQSPFAQVSCFCWRSPRQETWVPVEQFEHYKAFKTSFALFGFESCQGTRD